jgi:hypothetical protein
MYSYAFSRRAIGLATGFAFFAHRARFAFRLCPFPCFPDEGAVLRTFFPCENDFFCGVEIERFWDTDVDDAEYGAVDLFWVWV